MNGGAVMLAGWRDPVHDSQAAFRAILAAFSEPGTIVTLPVAVAGPMPLDPATNTVLLALADYETPLWLCPQADTAAVQAYLRFHSGCPLTRAASEAAFALVCVAQGLTDLAHYAQGSMDYPDRSTTLLVQVPSLVDGPPRLLTGPGIATTRMLQVAGLPLDFTVLWQRNGARFPMGVDLIFCCGDQLACLPRTTRIDA